MDFLFLAVALFLPAAVGAHRLAVGRRFPGLNVALVAAGAAQVLLPAALFGFSNLGVRMPTEGGILGGFWEMAFAATASFAATWGLLLVLVVSCWARPAPRPPDRPMQQAGGPQPVSETSGSRGSSGSHGSSGC